MLLFFIFFPHKCTNCVIVWSTGDVAVESMTRHASLLLINLDTKFIVYIRNSPSPNRMKSSVLTEVHGVSRFKW